MKVEHKAKEGESKDSMLLGNLYDLQTLLGVVLWF